MAKKSSKTYGKELNKFVGKIRITTPAKPKDGKKKKKKK